MERLLTGILDKQTGNRFDYIKRKFDPPLDTPTFLPEFTTPIGRLHIHFRSVAS